MLESLPWLLVFDLDGTLIDSSLDLCLAVNAAMRHVGSAELSHQRITGFIGDGAAMLIHRALNGLEQRREAASLPVQQEHRFQAAMFYFLRHYREHKLDNTRLHKGVRMGLENLRDKYPECAMAVLTNKPVRPSREICEALGIAPFFFANYGGDSFRTKKPDPEGLRRLMHEAVERRRARGSTHEALSPTGVTLIGDSEIDVFTARNAGVLSLGCTYGLAPEVMLEAKPDKVCHSPTEWPLLL